MDGKRFAQIVGRALVLTGLLSSLACAPATPLSKQAKSFVRSVSINREVAMPVGSAWVLVCQRGDWPCPGIPLRQLTSDLGEVLRADFEAQLTKAGVFPAVVPQGGDAELTLSLLSIRLQVATGMCGVLVHCYKPMMVVDGVLRARDGALLWQRSAELDVPTGGVPKRALATYRQQPDLLRQDFATAAHVAAERLVTDMQK